MEHIAYTINAIAVTDAPGICHKSSYTVTTAGNPDPVYAGVIVGPFRSEAEARAAAVGKASEWVEEQMRMGDRSESPVGADNRTTTPEMEALNAIQRPQA